MEREIFNRNLIIVLLLTIANATPSSQNPYVFTTTASPAAGDRLTDYAWPADTATPIDQDSTTYAPMFPTDVRAQDRLESSESNARGRYTRPPYREEEDVLAEDDDPRGPPDHAIPYSEHEEARDVATRPKYVAPGAWARPPPGKDVPLDFVPTKLHAQVRGSHTVKRLPQREAAASAESDEERRNAHRLREVVSDSKVNTVYTEEGYEDSAYDHAGHVRDADFHEGFARKLHDRENDKRDSGSGKRRRGERVDLIPDEFKEYDEDYLEADRPEESGNSEETTDDCRNDLAGDDGDAWKKSEVDPKFVAESGIRELEENVEKDAEEAEESLRIHQSARESGLHDDDDDDEDSGESEEFFDKDDDDDEKFKRVKAKKKKFKPQDEEVDAANGETKKSKGLKRKKKHPQKRYETATTLSDSGASSIDAATSVTPRSGFATSNPPSSSQAYSVQSTLRYATPAVLASFQQIDEPTTTINYGQIFWDYFKTRPDPSAVESSTLVPSSTAIPGARTEEEQTPIAVATIDGYGPYLLVRTEKTTTLPSTFHGSPNSQPRNLFADSAEFDPISAQGRRHPPGQSSGYAGNVNNAIAASTITAFTTEQPLLLRALQPSGPESAGYPSTTTAPRDPTSGATLNVSEDANSRIGHYQTNPFLGPILDNGNVAGNSNAARSKFKYKVLVRSKPKKFVKPAAHQSPRQSAPSSSPFQQADESKKIIEELSAKYNKMLDHLKKQRQAKSLLDNEKIVRASDFAPTRSPSPQRAAYPFFPGDRPPIADHSSVSVVANEPPREISWRGPLPDQHRSQPADLPSHLDPLHPAQPVYFDYLKHPLPSTRLVPPPPPPSPSVASNYASYRGNRQNNDYFPYVGGKPTRQRDGASRYFPSEAGWRTRSRRKRSGEMEPRDGGGRRSGRSRGKSHEELLEEAYRINSDVIDREIAERFNETGGNGTSAAASGSERDVEVEVPGLDYVEELAAEGEPAVFLTTTEIAVDPRKYPFYENEKVPRTSALKYVVDPRTVPRKTSRGMEFYDSRDAYKRCDEVEPDLDGVAEKGGQPDGERDSSREEATRLRGLGEKLDCFKAKYFDERPLDNPLFAERLVEEPTPPPLELDLVRFASKVMLFPAEDDEYVVPQASRKPERGGRGWKSGDPRYRESHESIRVNYKHDPRTGKGRNAYLHTVRGSRPSVTVRRTKNRRSRVRTTTTPATTTTQSPRQYQTASYHNQVYEDVMGNIRNQVNSYQVYETTTLPPVTQILAAASNEDATKVANVTSSLAKKKKKTAPPVDADASSSASSSEIRGLVPPPKYARQSYRKRRPPSKSRMPFLRSPNLSHIIAHHHTLKINKRSVDAAKDSPDGASSESARNATGEATKVAVIGNDTVEKSTLETTTGASSTSEAPEDLRAEESRRVRAQEQRPFLWTVPRVIDGKGGNSSEQTSEPSRRVVYTIRDRIRYSKPRWNAMGFGKFGESPTTTADADGRRKEPRYNYVKKTRPTDERRVDSTTTTTTTTTTRYNATDGSSRAESATSSALASGESGDAGRRAESVARQSIYDGESEFPDSDEIASYARFEDGSAEEEEEEEEAEKEETESTTTANTYRVRENVDEDAPETSTTGLPSPLSSREILNLRAYLETDPPGYAEAFPEETTQPSERSPASDKPEEGDERSDEEIDNFRNLTSPWQSDSAKKVDQQTETPVKSQLSAQGDFSEELSSGEREESAKDDRTFFAFTQPPWTDRRSEKESFYRPFLFSNERESKKEEGREEDRAEEASEERSKEKSEDRAFSWRADRENNGREKPWGLGEYEYPWEKRERLARERRRKRKRADRHGRPSSDDDDEGDGEGIGTRERPAYSWDRYDVLPSRSRSSARRRDVSRPGDADDDEESRVERSPFARFSSRYSSGEPSSTRTSTRTSTSARGIDRSGKRASRESEEETSGEEVSRKTDGRSLPRTSSSGELAEEPGDVARAPGARKERNRNSRADRRAPSDSQFDSRRLKSIEIDDREENGEKLELSASRSDSTSPVETSARPDVAKKMFPASSPRKKRRRIVPKNGSAIPPVDTAPADEGATTKRAKRRRKKSQVSSTTSASSDLETSKSASAPVRRRILKTDGVDKGPSRSSSPKKAAASAAAKATGIGDVGTEVSTPKTWTTEHRLRVSKEKIVTKLTYPNDAGNLVATGSNATSARDEPARRLSVRLSGARGGDKRNLDGGSESDRERTTGQRDAAANYEVGEDEAERSAERSRARGESAPLRNFGIKRDEVKRINDFGTFGGIGNGEDDGDDDDAFGDATASEVSLSPQHRTFQLTQSSSKRMLSSLSWISNSHDY